MDHYRDTESCPDLLVRAVNIHERENGLGRPTGASGVALLLEITRRLGAAVRIDEIAEVFFDLVCPTLNVEDGRFGVVRPGGSITVLRRRATGLWYAPPDPVADAALLSAARQDQLGVQGEGPTAVALRVGTAIVGAIALPTPAGHDLARGQREFLDLVAALIAQAVQRVRLLDSQLGASAVLQQALLPPALPEIVGLDVAGRYRAGPGHEVGGDWYDVIPLPNGWVAFVIGDVQGHDLEAAALMGQIRSVVRAYLLDELPPTAVLTSANTFLMSLEADLLVSVCVALVHPHSRLVTVATAGHACPLLLRPGRRGMLLDVPEGPPLGVLDDINCRERTTPLPDDAVLVLYTDGLIERRDTPYAEGERRLLDGCALIPDAPADLLADAVLASAGLDPVDREWLDDRPEPVAEDDTALLVLRWRGPGPPEDEPAGRVRGLGPVRALPVMPSSAVIARWYVEDLFGSWGVDADTMETAILLTDEIVANAVRHAHRTIRLTVTAEPDLLIVEVFDDSHREPRLGDLPRDATSGRGLRLVDALATDWGVRTSAGDLGKTVWFTLAWPPGPTGWPAP